MTPLSPLYVIYFSIEIIFRKVLSAPNLLRIGATENIFVECHDCSGADIDVQIVVKLFSTGALELDSTTVTLTDDNNFQAFGEIKVWWLLVTLLVVFVIFCSYSVGLTNTLHDHLVLRNAVITVLNH